MRIVCISDTHGRHDGLLVPDGDLLLHAGDLTKRGTPEQLEAADRWLASLPHRHKVVIAGNHDFGLEADSGPARITGATYLRDDLMVVDGLRIWGSPWQPRFFDWAFNLDRGEPLRRVWAMIPDGTDILLTHGPPRGILDRTASGVDAGCDDLRDAVFRIRPKLHVFGHIHEAYGELHIDGVHFVNASSLDLSYRRHNAAIVVDL